MLINQVVAAGIADGSITLVLRRWDAPRAKPGGTQRTPAGTIRIDGVREYPANYVVTRAQARAAGCQETARFKRRVRQLKGLGLTISLDVGYRISPRGRSYLKMR